MLFRKVLFVAFAVFAFVPMAGADISQNDIQSALTKNLSHPYLYFSDADKPAMLERIKNDPECRDIMARLLAEANRLMYTPVEQQAPVEEKNTRYFSSGEYDRYYYFNRSSAHKIGRASCRERV